MSYVYIFLVRLDFPRLDFFRFDFLRVIFPPGWATDILGRTAALKAVGNAIQPQTAVVAWGQLIARHEAAS
jgi:hypothetical protein